MQQLTKSRPDMLRDTRALLKAIFAYGGPLWIFRLLRRLRHGPCVTILCCHRVLLDNVINDTENRQSLIGHLSASTFARCMTVLKRHYDIISIGEAVDLLRSGNIRRDSLVLTFDDGFYDNYEIVVPILRSLQIPATMYLATSVIGQSGTLWFNEGIARFWQATGSTVSVKSLGRSYPLGPPSERIKTAYRFLTDVKANSPPEKWHDLLHEVAENYRMEPIDRAINWDEARALAREPLVTIGGHTVNHYILSRCTPELAHSELEQSRRTLKEMLQVDVNHFAYPRGHQEDFGEVHVQMLQELGYHSAVTTAFGVNYVGADLYRLKRVGLSQPLCTSIPDVLLRAAGVTFDKLRATVRIAT